MSGQANVAGRRETLRMSVLQAAEARIARSGLAELGVREIARDAGCSSGMVYKLFNSQDELVLSVNARTLSALADTIAVALEGAENPADALSAMADAYLDFARANLPRWDALFAHRMAHGAALPAWYADRRDRLFNGLAALIDTAALPVSGDAFARTLFSAVHGVVALGLEQKIAAVSPDALRAELRLLIRVITSGLFEHAPAYTASLSAC